MRNLELCTDIAEVLTGKCVRLKALAYLFSEQYTVIQLKDIPDAIQRNPEAFTDSFAIIEEMIDNIHDVADTLTDELFKAKGGQHHDQRTGGGADCGPYQGRKGKAV